MIAPKLIAGALARDQAADTILAVSGISTALVSGCFAGYMILTGPHDIGRRGDAPAVVRNAHVDGAEADETLPAPMAAGDMIDFTPTGTIPAAREISAPAPAPAGLGAALGDFAVRDVFDGTALVEARGALHMVSAGDTLEGAGEVLSIERKGRGWIVRTSGGIIRQRR